MISSSNFLIFYILIEHSEKNIQFQLNLKRENIHGDVLELLKTAKTELHDELTRLKKEKFSPDVEIGK